MGRLQEGQKEGVLGILELKNYRKYFPLFHHLQNLHLTLDMLHLLGPGHLLRQHLQGKILGRRLVQAETHAGKSPWEGILRAI